MEIFNVKVNSTLNSIYWSNKVNISTEMKQLQLVVD
jgi:hypothetical protein